MVQRTPTSILEAKGSFEHDPARGRARKNEPKPQAGIGQAPAHLDELHAQVWDEIVGIMPPRVLGNTDRMIMELLCRKVVKMRTEEKFTAADEAQMRGMLASLGMTPADRSRVQTIPDDKPTDDPWDGF